ncbi:MAG TPA: DUF1932 domain-containing protein [Stellaceae bacterium]|nr:DUF1932 domain-containing protein [Stellaceae bacterium]
MTPTIAIIAPGEMGSAVGARLKAGGARVLTSLEGRGPASVARAARAGFETVADPLQLAEEAQIILSIVPPGAAIGLAERLAPALTRARRKPVYVDCNAVAPATALRIGAILRPTGCAYVDAGIIGPPPSPKARTVFYAAGEAAPALAALREFGLDLRVLAGPVGAASALKMSYAGLTKGLVALGTAMSLGAARGGTTAALIEELRESQPALVATLTRLPTMFPKAYRWVAEMEEIAGFLAGDPAARQIYLGAARLYERLAEDSAASAAERDAIAAFARALGAAGARQQGGSS